MTDVMRVTVPAETRSYAVVAGWNVARDLGRLLTEHGLDGRPFLFLDAGIEHQYGPLLTEALSFGQNVAAIRLLSCLPANNTKHCTKWPAPIPG